MSIAGRKPANFGLPLPGEATASRPENWPAARDRGSSPDSRISSSNFGGDQVVGTDVGARQCQLVFCRDGAGMVSFGNDRPSPGARIGVSLLSSAWPGKQALCVVARGVFFAIRPAPLNPASFSAMQMLV